MAEVKSHKVKQLSSRLDPNAIYWVQASANLPIEGFITDINGVPYPLKDISGSGGITDMTNTDGNLVIIGASSKVINIAPALLSVINSALQSGDNISELTNDAGYITSFTETDPIFQASEASLFVTGDKVNLDNQSGINSGDETTLSIQTKRPLKTVNNESLEGIGNIQIDYNDLDNLPTLIENHSELILDDGTNPHGTTKTDVGLENVDNTSDLNKPISTATQTALNDRLQWLVKDTTPTTAVTGTTSLTQIGSSILIPANTFSAEDVMILDSFACQKTAGLGTCVLSIWCNTANTLTGATIILAHSMAVNTISGKVIKTFEITGGLMNARVNGPSGAFTDIGNVLLTPLSITFNPTIDNYFFTTVTLSNASDSVTRRQLLISK